MANIVVIENDPKTSNDIKNYINELDKNNETRIFSGIKNFEEVFFNNAPSPSTLDKEKNSEETEATSAQNAPPPDNSPLNEKSERLSTIDLLILKVDLLDDNLTTWIRAIQQKIAFYKYKPEGKSTRFIITKFEDDKNTINQLIHPLIDDVIFSPIDRLIFLQKLEIILNLPEKSTPSFLYSEKINHEIEISKRSQVHYISDIGFAIINPTQLSNGTFAHFYLRLPESDTINFYAKVHTSKPHPKYPHQYLIYFIFHALSRKSLMSLKAYFNQKKIFQHIKDDNNKHFELSDLNIFASESEREDRNILIIDPDPKFCTDLQEMLSTQLSCINASYETSYRDFISKYYRSEGEQIQSKYPMATQDDLSKPIISWEINSDSKELSRRNDLLSATDNILGLSIAEIFLSPTSWQVLFQDPDTSEQLLEAFKILKNIDRVDKLMVLSIEGEGHKIFSVTIKRSPKKNVAELSIQAPTKVIIDERSLVDKMKKKLGKIDLLIIDYKMIPGSVDEWHSSLKQTLQNKNYITNSLKVIIIGDGCTQFKDICQNKKFVGVFEKPLPTHNFLLQVSIATDNDFTKYNFENTLWSELKSQVYVAKTAFMETISEFGATLELTQSIAPGTTLFLHGSIFDLSPYKTLTAKFYHTEVHPEKEGKYICSVLFYGINENFLIFIRNWIRENYASQKEKEQAAVDADP